MIKFSVLYPFGKSSRFDWDYFCNHHAPLVKSTLGKSLKGFAIDRGISSAAPNSSPKFVAALHLYFEDFDSLRASLMPNKTISDDIRNYTYVKPLIQISEVVMSEL
jgi:uncharacterized protein (TIGR02118 family)